MLKKMFVVAAVVAVSTVGLAGCSFNGSAAQDQKDVASTYETYVNGVFAIPEANIQSTYTSVKAEVGSDSTVKATDAQKKDVVKQFTALAPSTFKLLDLNDETVTEQGQAVVGSVATAVTLEGANVTVAVPTDAITVSGDNATIDITKIKVNYTQGTSSVDRPKYTEAQLSKFGDIKLVKKNNSWLISSHKDLLAEIIH